VILSDYCQIKDTLGKERGQADGHLRFSEPAIGAFNANDKRTVKAENATYHCLCEAEAGSADCVSSLLGKRQPETR
jgi:hypothetical protein